jgi:hypothetical protein
MINYTDRLSVLMKDIVERVPTLSFIDMSKVVVFGRAGRTRSEGAFATCHCMNLPPSDPGYYFWRDCKSGEVTRRSEWFVTKSPSVEVNGMSIEYLISFTLPRFCDQTLSRSGKHAHYPGRGNWIAKLDTVVHELYHIDPDRPGIRQMERADGTYSANCHGGRFFEHVVAMVKAYLATDPNPDTYDFLKYNFSELQQRFGGVAGTAFRSFPSYPQRYTEVLNPQPPATVNCPVDPVKAARATAHYTDDDLTLREFLSEATRLVSRRPTLVAA